MAPDKPFCLYYAPGACHAPHHAPKEWIEKYKGRFDMGYEAMREQTLVRQKQLGIVPERHASCPDQPDRHPGDASRDRRASRSRSSTSRGRGTRCPTTSAGCSVGWPRSTRASSRTPMIRSAVCSTYLEETEQLENTMIVLVSDNGASGEGGPNGSLNENKFFNGVPDDIETNLAMIDELGGPKTYNHYPNGWAMAFNTPFKMWKRYEFNGGSCDPCMISWPKGIEGQGRDPPPVPPRDRHHADHPRLPRRRSRPRRSRGTYRAASTGSACATASTRRRSRLPRSTQFYSMLGSRAIWHEGWKAVSTHPTVAGWSDFNDDTWELYHVDDDRAELHDLAERASRQAARADQPVVLRGRRESGRSRSTTAQPIEILNTPRPQLTSPRNRYRYFPGVAEVPEAQAVNIRNRNYIIGVLVDIPAPGASRRAVRARLALRRPHPLRQGQPAPLRLQLRRHARAEDRRDREPLPVGENLILSAPSSSRTAMTRQASSAPASCRSTTARRRSARDGSRPSRRHSA